MDLKLSWGRGSKFSTRYSNRMLVVYVLLYKLQFFHSGFGFHLEDSKVKSSLGFYWFGFLGDHILCYLFSAALHDLIFIIVIT